MTYGLLFIVHLIGGCLALNLYNCTKLLLQKKFQMIKTFFKNGRGLANDNRTTSARLKSASAEKSLDTVLGKAGMT